MRKSNSKKLHLNTNLLSQHRLSIDTIQPLSPGLYKSSARASVSSQGSYDDRDANKLQKIRTNFNFIT